MTNSGARLRLATTMVAFALLVAAMMAGMPAAATAQSVSCWSSEPSMANGYQQWSAPPQMVIDPSGNYTATIETNRGTIVVDLLAEQAPSTVNNFVCLALAGYYDVTVFHRIIQGFMIQGGDPTGTGSGGPGYQFADELPTGDLPYTRGTVAMANAGANTNGSQFFIVQQDQPAEFPSNYSVFGRVTEGMDVVDAIAAAPVAPNARGETSSPLATIGIKSITVTDGSGNALSLGGLATPTGATPAATTAAVQPTETPAAAAATGDDDDGGSNLGLWIAIGVALVAGVGYFVWNQRRRPQPTARARSSATTAAPDAASATDAPVSNPASTRPAKAKPAATRSPRRKR
jgi:cyclophilin family peptidyl-prolyl cis-trans isomerase